MIIEICFSPRLGKKFVVPYNYVKKEKTKVSGLIAQFKNIKK